MNVRLLLVFLLAFSAVASALQHYEAQTSVDFYHYWAFANAKKMTTKEIGDPYTNREGYRNVLRRFGERYLAEGGQPRFRAVHDFRVPVRTENGKRIDKLLPTGPPLLYASFWFLPVDYFAALRLYTVMQMLAFLGGILLLVHAFRIEWITGLALAFFLAQAFHPFLVEMRVGNVNALQFLVASALCWLARVMLPRSRSRVRAAWGTLFVFLCLWFLLVKLNVLPMIVLVLVHFGMRYGAERRFVVVSSIAGMALAGLAVLWSSAYFGSWGGVWFDWWAYIKPGQEGSLLEFARELGNTSPALLLKDWLGVGTVGAAILVALFFAASYLIVERVRPLVSTGHGFTRDVRAGLRERLLDPGFCIATGILVVLSAMPLVWYHYYVLFPLPLLYAIATSRGPTLSVLLAAIATVPYLPTLNEVFTISSIDVWATVVGMPFVPLWFAILLRPREASEEPVPSAIEPALV
ncbi:MAG: hypothetical protein H6834_15995 [Planctomycetes bacterium]|nr:hypothetical protein [Planctomycetota bacterium]